MPSPSSFFEVDPEAREPREHYWPVFEPLGPEWWGYILGAFLPISSLYTIKLVCKSWNALTLTHYYTAHAPLCLTDRILSQIAQDISSLPPKQQDRRVRRLSLHLGSSVTIGVARDADNIHDVTKSILDVSGPVKRVALSIDTQYLPIARALLRLVARSGSSLLELKLRGARVSLQLSKLWHEEPSTPLGVPHKIRLDRLQVLEVDDVFFLPCVSAPKVTSLFVDYAEEADDDLDRQTSAKHNLRTPESARAALVEFLSHSGLQLQSLAQASITSRLEPAFRTGLSESPCDRTQASRPAPIACLPRLKELAVSDWALLIHVRTVVLESLCALLPHASLLFFLQLHACELRTCNLRLPARESLAPTTPAVLLHEVGSERYRGTACPLATECEAPSPLPGSTSAGMFPCPGQGPCQCRADSVADLGGKWSAVAPYFKRSLPNLGARVGLCCQDVSRLADSGKPPSRPDGRAFTSPPGRRRPPLTSVQVFLPRLTDLTVPGQLLHNLCCPELLRLHVVATESRRQVLTFLQHQAPNVATLEIGTFTGAGEARTRLCSPAVRLSENPDAVCSVYRTNSPAEDGQLRVKWHLPNLTTYKGPASLLGRDMECCKLEQIQV